ncbi:MAG: hypothetical protein J7J88_03685 [Dehalococcoidia bacterium]|nr:hypothetical protein [Dehalococcoidia bacterium]
MLQARECLVRRQGKAPEEEDIGYSCLDTDSGGSRVLSFFHVSVFWPAERSLVRFSHSGGSYGVSGVAGMMMLLVI